MSDIFENFGRTPEQIEAADKAKLAYAAKRKIGSEKSGVSRIEKRRVKRLLRRQKHATCG